MSGSYGIERAAEAHAALVDAGNGRKFLVVSFLSSGWKTLVFQHSKDPDSWLSRREISGNMDPDLAVTGFLLGAQQLPHPIEILKADLERLRRSNWDLHNRLQRANLLQKIDGKKKRGTRVRRNP